jgi:hypothetical protein
VMRETPPAAQAFEQYYDLGDDRSLIVLAQAIQADQKQTKSRPKEQAIPTILAQLKKWSTKHQWQERVKMRDMERAEAKRKKRDADIEAMDERHARIGTSLQLKGLKRADELLELSKADMSEAIRMIKLGTDLERVARGAPTDHRREEHVGDGGGPIEFEIELVGKSPDENEE